MRKIKILSLLLLVVMLLSCTSCKRISQSKFLDIVNSPMENYSCEMQVKMKMKMAGQSVVVPIELYLEVDEEEVYTSMEVQGQSAKVYYKIVGDKAEMWANDGYGWKKQSNISLEEVGTQAILPQEKIKKGDFKYKKGVWVGNVDKISEKLEDVVKQNLEAMQSMGGLEDVDFELELYNITIEDEEISKVEMEISFEMVIQGQSVDVTAKYEIDFSDIGSTKVTKPNA